MSSLSHGALKLYKHWCFKTALFWFAFVWEICVILYCCRIIFVGLTVSLVSLLVKKFLGSSALFTYSFAVFVGVLCFSHFSLTVNFHNGTTFLKPFYS